MVKLYDQAYKTENRDIPKGVEGGETVILKNAVGVS